MVMMVVGDQNVAQHPARIGCEPGLHRRGIAGSTTAQRRVSGSCNNQM
jgi:hypothetical protein